MGGRAGRAGRAGRVGRAGAVRAPIGGCNIVLLNEGGGREGREAGRTGRAGRAERVRALIGGIVLLAGRAEEVRALIGGCNIVLFIIKWWCSRRIPKSISKSVRRWPAWWSSRPQSNHMCACIVSRGAFA